MTPNVRDGKILMVTEPSGGGSGRHFIDLSRELTGRGYKVHAVYSPVRAENSFVAELGAANLDGITAIPMRRSVGPNDAISALQLKKVIGKYGPFSVVHSHSSKAGAIARMVTPRAVARIYTPHAFRTMDPNIGHKGKIVYSAIERFLAVTSTDAIIAVSAEERDHAVEIGIPEHKIHVVQNGVDPSPTVNRDLIRSQLGIAADEIVVGFVGRMSAQKNPIKFAQAISKAVNIDRRVRGVMIGDGELLENVRQVADNRILLLGNQNARQFLPAFDIFMMTSNYEAMPYVLIEALHAGLPIISSKVGGTNATVLPGKNAACLPVGASPDDFARVILSIVEDKLTTAYGHASLALSEKFTVAGMTDETLAVYRAAKRELHG